MQSFLSNYQDERDSLLEVVARIDGDWRDFRAASHVRLDDDTDGLIAAELRAVRDAIACRKLSIGIFGLIKRGKSTLYNALLGHEISPVHVTPETGVPILADHAEVPAGLALLASGEEVAIDHTSVGSYTSQKISSEQRDQVAYVHLHVPSDLLARGVRLIDTPGLDDAEVNETYTERTLQQLDAVDAGIMVVLSPPTLGAAERTFLRDVSRQGGREFLVACNMVPQHYHDPSKRADVLRYVRDQVASTDVVVHPVCAQDTVQALRDRDWRAWELSGLPGLLCELEEGVMRRAARRAIGEAAAAVKEAVRLARMEVSTERALLTDPGQLDQLRREGESRVEEVRRAMQTAIDGRLERLQPLPDQFRGMLFQRFVAGRQAVLTARSEEELERVLRDIRRQVEVTTEMAARHVREVVAASLRQLNAELGDDLAAVVAGGASSLRFGEAVHQAGATDEHRGPFDPVIGGAAVGGLVGGLGLTALGLAFGPVGLVAGAIVGWRLGSAVRAGRTLNHARELVVQRVDELTEAIAREFEQQLEAHVEEVRAAVDRRYSALAADLHTQVAAVEAMLARPVAVLAKRVSDCDALLSRLDEAEAAIDAVGTGRPRLSVVHLTADAPAPKVAPPVQPLEPLGSDTLLNAIIELRGYEPKTAVR